MALTEAAAAPLPDNVFEAARKELIVQVRAEQDWISGVSQLGWRFEGSRENRALMQRSDPLEERRFWLEENRKGRELLFDRRANPSIQIVLEEYELLFPETKRVRVQIGRRATQTIQFFSEMIMDLLSDQQRNAAIQKMVDRFGWAEDYSAVLEDLRRHIQNATYSELTGLTVPARVPGDPTVPLMTMRADGLLDIATPTGSWPLGDEHVSPAVDHAVAST